MNDDLRSALHEAVPEPPDPSGWAGAARDRARWTARLRASGAGLLALGLVAAVLWPLLGGQGGRTAVPAGAPAATSSVEPALPVNTDCTDDLTGTKTLAARGNLKVTRMSLCPRSDGPTFTTPIDAVTTDGSALYDQVQALPAERSADPDCDRKYERRYLLVFTLGDGSTQALEAATPNACTSEDRQTAQRWAQLLKLVTAAWTTQRTATPPAEVARGCLPFDRPGLLVPHTDALSAATLCQYDSNERLQAEARATSEELATLALDLATNTSRASNIDSRLDGAVLTVADAAGDPIVFWRVEGDQWFAFMPEGEQLFWQPGPEALDVLKLLTQRLQPFSPSPTATAPPPDPTPDCEGLTPSHPPAEIPITATRLRLCATGESTGQLVVPLDALTGDGVARVLNVVRSQPVLPTSRACRANLGPDFLLVAETDGQAPVVMVLQLYGCHVVGLQNQERGGADEAMSVYRAEIANQRNVQTGTSVRTGSLCGPWNSSPVAVMAPAPADLIAGRFCRYESREAQAKETALSDDDARLVAADLAQHSGKPAAVSCPLRVQPPPKLVLYNRFGDPLVLTGNCLGRYYFSTGIEGTDREWTPSPTATKRLNALFDR